MRNTAPKDAAEIEALETREWLDSLDYVLQAGGASRVSRLLSELGDHARRKGVRQPFTANTPYINTIPAAEQPPFPGSREIERRIKSLVRWNALAMVVKANKAEDGIGGHISTFASSATLYEVGFNHFFKGKGEDYDGDIIYFQGHAAPWHLRACLSRRTSERGEADELPPRAERGRRPLLVSAPVADARVLGISHGVDGHRADHRDLPGALHALPRRPRPEEAIQLEGLGVPR
jgi:hypothetical protein